MNPNPEPTHEARLHALLDRSPLAMAFVQRQHFVLASAQLEQMLHCGEGQGLAGQPTRTVLVDDASHAALHQQMREAYAREHSSAQEVELLRRDGTRFWARLQALPLEWAQPEGEALWLLEDVSLAHAQRQQPTWSTVHDELTELLNRREFERRLADHVGSRRHEPVSVLVLELDDFSAVNEQFGRPGGDHALTQVARLLQEKVRASDHVARLEGVCYAVLLPGCDAHWAEVLGHKLRLAVRQFRLRWGDKRTRVTASLGAVQLSPALATPEAVLAAALAASAQARRAGGNALRVHAPDAG